MVYKLLYSSEIDFDNPGNRFRAVPYKYILQAKLMPCHGIDTHRSGELIFKFPTDFLNFMFCVSSQLPIKLVLRYALINLKILVFQELPDFTNM